ncbi:nicotinate-nucleotide--dimethylbenzimidazole phosphoribosyltransferase [Paucibacter sp. APW11]|uniref:Nicotinate-nucleotide--dimethylbenzimidazole phosphoribosyltransferase n=1 Tax=Roseateles aquae TaxID=3077235 RepID=A0ABU3PHX3_9BURK|nr:nicotinate-nucleotide--dimethylbenzimidazole phosphoribosyltransferase [Paucibacter sp. APW11]MDT9002166.1 nicotinate-nucleotide--dimethylbenzimidazole phosphoribosyltransferase [Paucibacter sp. APW11]
MSIHQSLISPTANAELGRALRERVQRRAALAGGLGELESLAARLGLIQNTLTPRFRDPALLLFAADHGLATDRVPLLWGRSTRDHALLALQNRLPVAVFARQQGLQLTLVDCGIAEPLDPHPKLLARKIAHGTRNARKAPAMTLEQAHAGVRVGMEIADSMTGNVLACAGLGHGSHESAALVLSKLSDRPVQDFIISGGDMRQDALEHLLAVLGAALTRHQDANDPMEVLAALGGHEISVMVGAMLVAASKRNLIIVDGLSACAALKVAAMIAAPVTDYAVFCRSHTHRGLDEALTLFHAAALLELGMDSADGTGATLAWPLIRTAGAMLTEVQDSADAEAATATAAAQPPLPNSRPGRLHSGPGLLVDTANGATASQVGLVSRDQGL